MKVINHIDSKGKFYTSNHIDSKGKFYTRNHIDSKGNFTQVLDYVISNNKYFTMVSPTG